jgi:L-ascorbate metabolism protein UlaG (beta-lactamase superfamily)
MPSDDIRVSESGDAQLSAIGRHRSRVTFLGHATVLLELDGLRLLTDPVLRQQVGPLWRRAPRPHLGPLSGLDGVLISHLHLDHYDPASLRLLDKGVPIIGPTGSARSLAWSRFVNVYDLGPGERLRIGPVEIVATEAKHPESHRTLARRTPSVGYVISGSKDVYFAGDTALFPGMEHLWGDIDLALLPIAGLGPRLPEHKHLTPQLAVRAMELLRPGLVIPIHWGTYHLPGTVLMRMRPDVHRRAPLVFMREAALRVPEIRTVLLEPGQALDLDAPSSVPPHTPAGTLMRRRRIRLPQSRASRGPSTS